MMYVRWDSNTGDIIGSPSNAPGTEPDWVPCQMPEKRTSRAQELAWTLVDGVLVGDWVGSDDPKDAPADAIEIRKAWLGIMQYPIAADNGLVFDFDRDSRDLIRGAIAAMNATGANVDWRLYDNSTVTVDATQLQAYFDELIVNQAVRGLSVDAEYVDFKSAGATHGELNQWRASYHPDTV